MYVMKIGDQYITEAGTLTSRQREAFKLDLPADRASLRFVKVNARQRLHSGSGSVARDPNARQPLYDQYTGERLDLS